MRGRSRHKPLKRALKHLQISGEPLQVAKPPRIDTQFALQNRACRHFLRAWHQSLGALCQSLWARCQFLGARCQFFPAQCQSLWAWSKGVYPVCTKQKSSRTLYTMNLSSCIHMFLRGYYEDNFFQLSRLFSVPNYFPMKN